MTLYRQVGVETGIKKFIIQNFTKLFGNFIAGQEFSVLAISFNLGQLLAVIAPYPRGDALLAEQHPQNSAHPTVTNDRNILEHEGH